MIFHGTGATLNSWLDRVDEQGEHALIQIPEPMNRFPTLFWSPGSVVEYHVPDDGKGQDCAAGLHLSEATVGRMSKKNGPIKEPNEMVVAEDDGVEVSSRVVTAFGPHPRWPVADEAERVERIHLVVKFLEGSRHLPIVELKWVA